MLVGIPSSEKELLNRYENLAPKASSREVAGCTVYVAALEDIITSKEVADRQKDREALPELRTLRAAQLAAAAYPEGIEAALAKNPSVDPPEQAKSSQPGRDYGQGPPGRALQ